MIGWVLAAYAASAVMSSSGGSASNRRSPNDGAKNGGRPEVPRVPPTPPSVPPSLPLPDPPAPMDHVDVVEPTLNAVGAVLGTGGIWFALAGCHVVPGFAAWIGWICGDAVCFGLLLFHLHATAEYERSSWRRRQGNYESERSAHYAREELRRRRTVELEDWERRRAAEVVADQEEADRAERECAVRAQAEAEEKAAHAEHEERLRLARERDQADIRERSERQFKEEQERQKSEREAAERNGRLRVLRSALVWHSTESARVDEYCRLHRDELMKTRGDMERRFHDYDAPCGTIERCRLLATWALSPSGEPAEMAHYLGSECTATSLTRVLRRWHGRELEEIWPRVMALEAQESLPQETTLTEPEEEVSPDDPVAMIPAKDRQFFRDLLADVRSLQVLGTVLDEEYRRYEEHLRTRSTPLSAAAIERDLEKYRANLDTVKEQWATAKNLVA